MVHRKWRRLINGNQTDSGEGEGLISLINLARAQLDLHLDCPEVSL